MVFPQRDLRRFFRRRPLTFEPERELDGIKPIESANIDWWLWRPCVSEPPLCQYYQLKDGTYTLADLMDMHEVLDEREEYQRRYRVAMDKKG